MSQVGWFPRYSPDGSRLTWERPGYWRAQWLNATTEIADNGAVLVIGGAPVPGTPSCNALGAGGGFWAAYRTDPPRILTSDDREFYGAGCPAVNPDGRFACVDPNQADRKTLYLDGEAIIEGAITDVRCSRQALVWRDNGRTWGMKLGVVDWPAEIQVAPEEFGPVPIDTPDGPWVLNYTQTGIILRPFGETLGYRFDNGGQTYYPDAVYRDGPVISAVFTNDRGEQSEHHFDLKAQRESLAAVPEPQPPDPTPVPPDPPEPVPEPPEPIPVPPQPKPPYDRHRGASMEIDGKVVILRGPAGALAYPNAPNTGTWGGLGQGWRGVLWDGAHSTDPRCHHRATRLVNGAYIFTSLAHDGLAGADATKHSGSIPDQFYYKPDGNADAGGYEQWRVYDGNVNGALEAQIEYVNDEGRYFACPLAVEVVG